ncbi:MAG TPA: 50S ribosomal protein L22 [Sedimentisphaerales bacterium]|nr:50S ribosomal protein L22 [Sedimentisphaerales bacterium]
MLSAKKLKELCKQRDISKDQLAGQLVRGGLSEKQAKSAIENWKQGLFKPLPSKEDIRKLATALYVDVNDISDWKSSCRYAPFSARKARLVSQLIIGRSVQDAMDVLKFTNKRAAETVNKVLKSAIADADEQEANVDSLVVSEARVDGAGVRLGTKRWRAKDRGRAHSIRKTACHVHVTVTQA